MPLYEQYHKQDPQRLAFMMSLVGVSIAALGMASSFWAAYDNLGSAIFSMRMDRLGDYLSSPLAYVYNISLLLGGACFILAMGGLWWQKHSAAAGLLSRSGIAVGLGIVALGVFPYNELFAHQLAAIFFIASTLVMFTLCCYCFVSHRALCNLPLCLFSLLGIMSAIGLLSQLQWPSMNYASCSVQTLCPSVWFMWLHSIATVFAGLSLSATVYRLWHWSQPLND
ncbi:MULTISPECIES: hypothetical protein [Shewanella]|uniref:hypothetical protein n=1 Tax=Shewanella TaxID=22 RepID=UPI001AACD817|nr:hypothetical protein [Shewanella algae]MBO2599672.1 hypothetical protein [Shewanella algae]MBO2691039.1 hypothetical protein [Shewanella algae]QTE91700.1 hypothetical protein JKK33_04725 [Shewanella algae]UZD59466.1 hypothetical protein OLL83_000996 [Shewanella algae]